MWKAGLRQWRFAAAFMQGVSRRRRRAIPGASRHLPQQAGEGIALVVGRQDGRSRRDFVSPRAPGSDALDLASCDFRTISSSAGCRSLLSGYARRFAKRELAPLPREVGEGGAERRMGCGKQDCDNGGLRRRSCKASPVGSGGPYPIRPFGPPSPASWGRVCALTRPSRSPRATGAARLLARLRPSGLAQHTDGRTTRSRG